MFWKKKVKEKKSRRRKQKARMTSTTSGSGNASAPTPAPPPVSSLPTNGHKNGGVGTPNDEPDVVMMTPVKKEIDHTILRVERVQQNDSNSDGGDKQRHVAGGQHQGIIINKQVSNSGSPTGQANGLKRTYDLRLAFKVFLVNAITQIQQLESRELRFWFEFYNSNNDQEHENNGDGAQCAHSFFRELVNPADFPKNYVGFIMKLMKTMQKPLYRPLKQIELEVRTVDEPMERPPSASRPCEYCNPSRSISLDLSDSSNSSNVHQIRSHLDKGTLPRQRPTIAPKPKYVRNVFEHFINQKKQLQHTVSFGLT